MRYSRQELVIGKENQNRLKNKKVVVVGLGALGSVAAELLTRAGIGNLILIDRDYVELNNLQRQVLYNEDDVNKPKALRLKNHLEKINKDVNIKAIFDNLDKNNLDLIKADLVLDCTDNLETRFLINEYCSLKKIKWIYSAAIKNQGYVFNIIPEKACLRCFVTEASLESCETAGILNSISNLIGSIQVSEALKILLNKDYEKDLIYVNLDTNNIEKIKVSKDKECSVCNGEYEYLYKDDKLVKFCGSNSFIFNNKVDLENVKNKIRYVEKIIDYGDSFYFNNITVFRNKILIKARTEKEARSIYSRYIGN